MPYAANDQVSNSPVENGIPITDKQYREAISGMASGLKVQVADGVMSLVEPPTERTTYWVSPSEKYDTEPGEDIPDGATTTPPPTDYHVLDSGQWVEDVEAKANWFMGAIQSRADAELQRGVSVTINGTTYGIRTGPQALALIDGAAIRADVAKRANESVTRRVPTDQGIVQFDGPALWSIFEAVETHQQAVSTRAEELQAKVTDGSITEADLDSGW